MHHYRNCQGVNGGFAGLGKPVLEQHRVIDKSIYKYKELMDQSQINKIITNIFKFKDK